MGFVLQRQRGAIESLFCPGLSLPKGIIQNIEFFLEGKQVFPWGTSIGLGTCSDIKDMNVLVLGYERANDPARFVPELGSHQYAVLARKPSEKEENSWPYDCGCLMAVELLNVRVFESTRIELDRAGKVAVYPRL